jgi:hypothetical protein
MNFDGGEIQSNAMANIDAIADYFGCPTLFFTLSLLVLNAT